jgi:hypothetical protein
MDDKDPRRLVGLQGHKITEIAATLESYAEYAMSIGNVGE